MQVQTNAESVRTSSPLLSVAIIAEIVERFSVPTVLAIKLHYPSMD